MAEQKYKLLVSAGPSYDVSTHQLVPVNLPMPIDIDSDLLKAKVNVRIQKYRGLPSGSPETCEYFSTHAHKHDLYSISFAFKLSIGSDIPGDELLFGNDFDHSIAHNLPPGFNAALRMVRWTIDPGLDGDVYAETPYLYGPLLSSINSLYVAMGSNSESFVKSGDENSHAQMPVEGGDEQGMTMRKEHGVPDDSARRMKHFLDEHKRKAWTFEGGREYHCDFFNPYLDFNEFALKLPGLSIPILHYWDGQPLRYVLKHRSKDESIDKELLVIMFNLVPTEDSDKEESKWNNKGQAKTATVALRVSKKEHADPISSVPLGSPEHKKQDYSDEGID